MELKGPKDKTKKYATILLLGAPKVGKTLLASTAPSPFFLDLENGATSTGCWRITVTKDGQGFATVKQQLEALARLKPGPDGLLHHKIGGVEFPVGTVVIDTMDELQLIADLTINATGQRYWGQMLKLLRGIITTGRRINAHLIVIAHSKVFAGDDDGQLADVGLALQGGIRAQLPGWFDVILHLAELGGQGRQILTESTIHAKKRYLAGDRHYLFRGKNMPLKWQNDKPALGTMETLLSKITTGGVKVVGADPAPKLQKDLEEAEAGVDLADLKSFAMVYDAAVAHLGYASTAEAKTALKEITAGDKEMLKKGKHYNYPGVFQLLKDHKNAPPLSSMETVATEMVVKAANSLSGAPGAQPSGPEPEKALAPVEVQATEPVEQSEGPDFNSDNIPF